MDDSEDDLICYGPIVKRYGFRSLCMEIDFGFMSWQATSFVEYNIMNMNDISSCQIRVKYEKPSECRANVQVK